MLKRALLLLAIPVFVLFLAAPQAECRSPGHLFEVYTGKASFYSDKFHGRKTANGERYNKKALTAAHRFLPLGTVVRVTNLSNGRHLLVRINDRGPIKKSWILDVSREAASRLNMIRRGIAPVQVEVVADQARSSVQRGTAFFLKVGEVKNQREGEARVVALRKQARMRFCIPENAAPHRFRHVCSQKPHCTAKPAPSSASAPSSATATP